MDPIELLEVYPIHNCHQLGSLLLIRLQQAIPSTNGYQYFPLFCGLVIVLPSFIDAAEALCILDGL
jgi:hypothetical protein